MFVEGNAFSKKTKETFKFYQNISFWFWLIGENKFYYYFWIFIDKFLNNEMLIRLKFYNFLKKREWFLIFNIQTNYSNITNFSPPNSNKIFFVYLFRLKLNTSKKLFIIKITFLAYYLVAELWDSICTRVINT